MRFRARDDRQCSDTAASPPASPLDLPRTPASPGWQPHARHVIPEIVEQHDTCCDYHCPDHNRPDPVPTRSPPLRHTRRASQRNTNAIKTTSKRPSNSRKKTRSPTVVEARATSPPSYDPKVPHHDLDEEAEMCHRSADCWPTATAVH